MATVTEDEEEVAGRHSEPVDENDEDDDLEDDDEDESPAEGQDKFAAYEGRLRRTAASRLKAYREKLENGVKERIATRRENLDKYVQTKLDEWTMANIGTSHVQNPDAVAETLVRAAVQAEARINTVREQLAQLEAAGVDVSSIRERLTAPTQAA